MKNRPRLRAVLTFLAQIIIYLVVSIPFKVMEVIPGFTDIRPVSLLGPVYGIFCGPQGAFAFAVGNLITDIISDSLRWSCIAGFIANFAGPFLMYLYWCRISKDSFSLRSGRNILKHITLITAVAAIETIIITPAVAVFYPDVNYLLFAASVMLNTSVFPILLGIPLIFLIQEELGFKPASSPDPKKNKAPMQ